MFEWCNVPFHHEWQMCFRTSTVAGRLRRGGGISASRFFIRIDAEILVLKFDHKNRAVIAMKPHA